MNHNLIFYNRIKELMQLLHKSFNEVERDLGYPRNSLHNYKNGVGPSGKRLVEIATYFNVLPEYLIGLSNETNRSSKQLFQALDHEQRIEIYNLSHEWSLKLLLNFKDAETEKMNS